MIKYWYVVQKAPEYFIGYAYGRADTAEDAIIDIMN